MKDQALEKTTWTERLIREEKRSIQALLTQKDVAERGEFIRTEIMSLAAADHSLARLRKYLYVVAALLHHLEHPYLRQRDVRQSLELAEGILKVQRIPLSRSPLSFLYGDLYSLKSQIDRMQGHHLQAAWDQEWGLLSTASCQLKMPFQRMIYGNRLLRLGHSHLALHYFEGIDHGSGKERDSLWGRVRLARLRALRLQGSFAKTRDLLDESLVGMTNDPMQKELHWQRLCLELSASGQSDELIKAGFAAKEFGAHPSYLMETVLWASCIAEKKWLKKMPRGAAFGGDSRAIPQKSLLNFVAAIIQCYDYERPLRMRQEKLCQALRQTQNLFNIDKELLAWAAACRWFHRSRAGHLAVLALKEYQGLSLKLSGGVHKDVLFVLQDLINSKSLRAFW